MTVQLGEVDANGYRFRCRESGTDGEPVVLLHGFPETSLMWARLMERLASVGYRCLAPDQRGYSPGARPADVGAYRYEYLVDDVRALATAAGFERFHLVAHDWGATVGWALLSVAPSVVASYTALSTPHNRAFAEAVWSDPEEAMYRDVLELFLAADHAAEAALSADDYAVMRAETVGRYSPEEMDEYLSLWRQPGALTAALNYYRASNAHRRALDDPSFEFGPVYTPTLFLWGRNDAYIRRQAVDLAAGYMRGPYRVVELDAEHLLVQEAPAIVEAEVLSHLRAHPL